jgi:spore coat polysaccharide biosynthesis protein SpsF (cytidylyltransferase family)
MSNNYQKSSNKIIVCGIQARMASSRLPRKVIEPIEGRPMISIIVDSLNSSQLITKNIVLTSNEKTDDSFADLLKSKNIAFLRASQEDVLERYYLAAKKENADLIVRITGDCPLVDPSIVDEVIYQAIEHSADYCSNVGDRTFPRGYDVEVFTFTVLEKMYNEVTDPIEREYVTIHIRKNPNLYKIHNVSSKYNHSEWRVCVDTHEDLKLIKEIFNHYKNKKQISFNDVVTLFNKYPDLPKINAHVEQRKYMEK